jgi:hypothetical protein
MPIIFLQNYQGATFVNDIYCGNASTFLETKALKLYLVSKSAFWC